MPEFFNQATLTYNGQTRVSNIVTGFIREPVSLTKNSNKNNYTHCEEITYTISIINTTDEELSGLELTDDLGRYTISGGVNVVPLEYLQNSLRLYIGGILQPTPSVELSSGIKIVGLNIPASSNAFLQYTVTVNNSAPLGTDGKIVNNVTLNGPGIENVLSQSETIYANQSPTLEIVKSLSPYIVPQNGNLTYSFVIQNYGPVPTTASEGVSVEDNFNPIITSPSVTLNGRTLTPSADYSYNASTGEFKTLMPIIVPAASYTQNETTGVVTVTPGTATLTVSGNIT